MLRMTVAELQAFLVEHFPQRDDLPYHIENVTETTVVVRLAYNDQYLRPGGTISGPTLMALADVAMYLLVLARVGPVALAVTTNLNINFLRKPAPGDVLAHAQLLKLGARLAVGAVTLFAEAEPEPVAHATVTYSIPPQT